MSQKEIEALYGWTGKILRADLRGKTREEETARYAPTFIGGRGFAAKVAWDEIRPGTRPFDPQNPLIFFTGPLTGTMAPFSGRTAVAAVSPQVHPYEWFTRANLGGHWGPERRRGASRRSAVGGLDRTASGPALLGPGWRHSTL